MTYGDADALSAGLADTLRARGVRPGDRVAMQMEKSPFAVLLYLACLRSGAIFVPMNTAYTEVEVAHLVADAEPALVVRDAGEFGEVRGDVFEDVDPKPDDVAAILYTSGTTGRPKGAKLTHRNLASNAAALHKAWGFRPDDVLLHALPVFHAHGLFVAINCTLANGTPMIFLPRFDAGVVIESLPRATVFMGVPTFYTRLLADARFNADACTSMRLFISGSAPLLASTHDEFRVRTGHAVLERYGMTETTMITSNPLDGHRRPGSVGPPLPGVEVRVTNEQGAALAAGEVGGVEVRGPNVFVGYWKRPELSATEFTPDGFFRTGDLGCFDEDGYLRIVGRSKDLVISGGLNVYPIEVEEVIDAIDGVLESAVIGVADHDFGEAVVAIVVAEPGKTIDGESVRTLSRERLAAFKVPKRVHVVDALPRNAMGKVEKARLRSEFGG